MEIDLKYFFLYKHDALLPCPVPIPFTWYTQRIFECGHASRIKWSDIWFSKKNTSLLRYVLGPNAIISTK